jgi:hypothetical protein
MSDEENPADRVTPAKTQSDWKFIWDGAEKSHKTWVIIGPLHSVLVNWKAIVFVLLLILYINKPEILKAIETILGGGE